MNDKEIEKLLSELPAIKDHRPKVDVLARLKEDGRMQKSLKHKTTKKWRPAFVALASILVLSLLVPSLFEGNKGEQEVRVDEPMMSTLEKDDSTESSQNESEVFLKEDIEESASAELSGVAEFESNILIADELGEMRNFRIGLVSDEQVIPVTFLISGKQILADFPEGEPDVVQLYNQYAVAIPEEKLGFDNYHPYKGDIMKDGDIVKHQIPDGYSYDETPETQDVYLNSFQTTFGNNPNHQKVEAKTNMAKVNDSTKIADGNNPAIYYKYVFPNDQIFLVPQYRSDKSHTVEKALLEMKEPTDNRLEPLVPEHVKYDVRRDEEIVIISFGELLDLTLMNHEDAVAMIEGFILTAHHYQSVIKLENVLQNSFWKYNLETILPEPVAINPLKFIPE